MRKPLFVGLTTGAALLIGGGVAAAMAGGPVDGGRAAVTQPSASPPATPSASPSSRTTISRDEAKAIALRYVGGDVVKSAELEWEHGRLIWDIDVIRNGGEWDVEIDAASGKVVDVEAEAHRDDDRGREGDRGRDDGHDHDRSGPGGGEQDHDNSGPGGGDD